MKPLHHLFHYVLAAVLLIGLGSPTASAMEVRAAQVLWLDEQELLLRLSVDLDIPDLLAEAMANGIGVYFRSEIRLFERRPFWGEQVWAQGERSLRLEYNALSRHYRLIDLDTLRVEFAPTLGDALELLAQRLGRIRLTIEAPEPAERRRHGIAARVRIDQTALPLPLQWDTRLRALYVAQLGWSRWPLE